MLVQIGLIVFALLALLSLIIDVGYARLTQAQMQVAADAAALEGLRQRDVGVVDPATGQVVHDGFANDCLRRAAAHRVVRWVFDDDFGWTAGDGDRTLGAGPVVSLTGGATALHAYETIGVPDPPVYDPTLQLNQQNVVYGDMVSGRFCYNATPGPSEGPEYGFADTIVCDDTQRAFGAYARNDFNPSLDPPPPPAELPSCPPPDEPAPAPWPRSGSGPLDDQQNGAFLVRLRRSNDFQDVPGQTEPDVASSGPSLPLTFGKGALIQGDDPSSTYSVRRDGLTVRATAIADGRPALQVGLPQSDPDHPGVTPFALADTFAQTLDTPGLQVTLNPATGIICSGLTCTAAAPNGIGRFVDNLTDPARSRWKAIATVGQVLPAATGLACAAVSPYSGYGPVYSRMASGTNRVIGFVRVEVRRDPARPTNACAARLSRGVPIVAPTNATASLIGGLPLPVDTDPAEVRELLDKNLERAGRLAYGPVRVPVLAR